MIINVEIVLKLILYNIQKNYKEFKCPFYES
jgi:hypothetical protein